MTVPSKTNKNLAGKTRRRLFLLIPLAALAVLAIVTAPRLLQGDSLVDRMEKIFSKISSIIISPQVEVPAFAMVTPTPTSLPTQAAVTAVTRTPTPQTGPLRVDPINPRYFTNGSGKAILLVGDHTWYTLIDEGSSDPPAPFDYETYLDFLEANGVNFFRMFVWEQAKWSVGTTDELYFSPSPFERTGPGVALDGKEKFDLTQFNQAYFDRLRERVIAAGQRGIYVSIQLFQGFSVQIKPYGAQNNPWAGHPFNVKNNINGIDGDLNGNGEGEETETLLVPAVTAIQIAYVDKVIDTLNDLDNVLFEICNECQSESVAWQEYLIDHIHTYEAGKAKQHPVGMTIIWPGGGNQQLLTSPADWISPNADGGYFDNPPANDGAKVILNDTDHLYYPAGDRAWAWKSFLRGLNVAFMDPYDCAAEWVPSGCNPNDPTWVSLRKNLGYIAAFADRIDLETMLPHGELASSEYCLAQPVSPRAQYLVYLPLGGEVTVDLAGASGELSVEWFNPADGTTTTAEPVSGGTSRSFQAPFEGDAVLYLYQ